MTGILRESEALSWNRYHVMAWPTRFILDKEGYIRYGHVGEGDYAGWEAMNEKMPAYSGYGSFPR